MNRTQLAEELEKRRIFGIISHPDAGKTTLTEKLLLHGGAIHQAGTVKARKNSKFATSDWMEIEKQRGISVTSSVMQFDYAGKVISIMDTPGHNDFGEDTYRILTSVDSAVMVIDAAKGIEAQTRKLFAVCKMRGIPIFTFMNKLDREAKDPLDLLSELEEILGMPATAITWPIGSGMNFQGVYCLTRNEVYLFREKQTIKLGDQGVFGPELEDVITINNLKALREGVELLEGAGYPMDEELVLSGELTPVFFGSALADFGVTVFLEHFLQWSPAPGPRKTADGNEVDPLSDRFSGFVFKIQANMNPAHRDRLAFIRICSGEFERGMTVNLARTGKPIKLAQSTQLMANERANVDSAMAGDVIGIYDTGNFMVGDSIYTGKDKIEFEPLPTFPPEIFSLVLPKDTMKAKQFQKGVQQLAQEGAIQVYHNEYNETVIGAVGQLQIEVFQYRLENEYNALVRMNPLDYTLARWVKTGSEDGTASPDQLDHLKMKLDGRTMLVFDRYERPLILFANQFALTYFKERHPEVELLEATEV
ncbi:MAG: peptide chain release factor 3 [Firmicutes bacterium]|nr:peptide chain release factor 3 [Bacillota bacterium]